VFLWIVTVHIYIRCPLLSIGLKKKMTVTEVGEDQIHLVSRLSKVGEDASHMFTRMVTPVARSRLPKPPQYVGLGLPSKFLKYNDQMYRFWCI